MPVAQGLDPFSQAFKVNCFIIIIIVVVVVVVVVIIIIIIIISIIIIIKIGRASCRERV